jgi:hypothetical protein
VRLSAGLHLQPLTILLPIDAAVQQPKRPVDSRDEE